MLITPSFDSYCRYSVNLFFIITVAVILEPGNTVVAGNIVDPGSLVVLADTLGNLEVEQHIQVAVRHIQVVGRIQVGHSTAEAGCSWESEEEARIAEDHGG